MEIPSKKKCQAWMLPFVAAIILTPSQWNTASAQTAIRFSFTGSGTGNIVSGFSMMGSGAVSPYGPTTISVTGGPSGMGSLSIAFLVTFGDGSTVSATSHVTPISGDSISGTATITSGTGTFAGASGSYNYATTFVVTAGGFNFTNTGSGTITASGLSFIGSMAHLAAEENWTTTFTLVNKGAASSQAQISFFGDASDPTGNGPLTLALTFPQSPPPSGPLTTASYNQNVPANASLVITTAGPQTPPVLVGSAQLSATGPVDGFAIFHQNVTTQEAVVPLETRNANSYLLAYDNSNGLVLGVALENVSVQAAIIGVVIRDDTGAVISTPGTTISLGGNGHTSFVLSDPVLGLPVTANKRGTIEFDPPGGGQISVLGLRFTPPNNALTTIPALANVSTGGGSIAHLASGGDGWATTFRAGQHWNQRGASHAELLRRHDRRSAGASAHVSTRQHRSYDRYLGDANAGRLGDAPDRKQRRTGPAHRLGSTQHHRKRQRLCDLQPQRPGSGGATGEPQRQPIHHRF